MDTIVKCIVYYNEYMQKKLIFRHYLQSGIIYEIKTKEGNYMKSYSKTDVGIKRTMNQDSLFCSDNPVGSFRNLFIVADGMGGH